MDFLGRAKWMMEEEAGGIKKNGKIKPVPHRVREISGFSLRTSKGQRPFLETFGNIKESPKGPVIERVREPMVDIFNKKGQVLVMAELPGVSEEEVNIDVVGDILLLLASNKDRKYSKVIPLPAKVKKENMIHIYKNGVLEIALQKTNYSEHH